MTTFLCSSGNLDGVSLDGRTTTVSYGKDLSVLNLDKKVYTRASDLAFSLNKQITLDELSIEVYGALNAVCNWDLVMHSFTDHLHRELKEKSTHA